MSNAETLNSQSQLYNNYALSWVASVANQKAKKLKFVNGKPVQGTLDQTALLTHFNTRLKELDDQIAADLAGWEKIALDKFYEQKNTNDPQQAKKNYATAEANVATFKKVAARARNRFIELKTDPAGGFIQAPAPAPTTPETPETTTRTDVSKEVTRFDDPNLTDLERALLENPGQVTDAQKNAFEDLFTGAGETAKELTSSGRRGTDPEVQRRLLENLLAGERGQALSGFTQDALKRNQFLAPIIEAFQTLETGRTETEATYDTTGGANDLVERFIREQERTFTPELIDRLQVLLSQFQDVRQLDPSTLAEIKSSLSGTEMTTKENLAQIARGKAGTGTTFGSARNFADVQALGPLAKQSAQARSQALAARQQAFADQLRALFGEFDEFDEFVTTRERRETF